MLDELLHRLAAVASRVLDLLADVGQRLAFPGHLDGRDVPQRMSRDLAGIEVSRTMAGCAAHANGTETILATDNERLVRMAVVTLIGPVAGRGGN